MLSIILLAKKWGTEPASPVPPNSPCSRKSGGQEESIMSATERQARRAMSVKRQWDSKVNDPRKERNQLHGHHGLLSVMAVALACGKTCLRRMENFAADLAPSVRAKLGLKAGLSDTTLYRLLKKQSVTGLRESVWKHLRELFKKKVIGNDLFPVGVLGCDGKGIFASSSKVVKGAKVLHDKKHGVATSMLMSERAVLVSSSIRPCLDSEIIGEGTGESPAFRQLLPRMVKQFGKHFQIITADAGLPCRENAELVENMKKHYLFTLGKNLHRLFGIVSKSLKKVPLAVRDALRRDGELVERELFTLTVTDADDLRMPGAKQIWKLRQTVRRGRKVVSTKVRYFISSIPLGMLEPAQQLALIRLHWGIENGHNWTMDVALEEDDRQPCQLTCEAIEVVGWLRIIGYNILSAWRAGLPPKDGVKRPSWSRCMELLRDCFVFNHEARFATLF
ncbi:MAG: ISAs1 family transposase [Myxococcaceae bacterium]